MHEYESNVKKICKFVKRFCDYRVLWSGGEKMIDFGEIYTEYFTDVYKYVLSLSRDKAIAEDVTQETFFKAMQKIGQFNGSCKLYVWLCQIAKNTYFTLYMKQSRIVSSTDTELTDTAPDLEETYLDKDMARRLHIHLHNMGEPYKEVFTLRVFGELPFSQIGELFGKTDSWARLVFYRAKKQLQEVMK
jgi:RNA polymerase sigma-70 factor (ECF subfamily)